jgi:CheY-like chemotaxis protein
MANPSILIVDDKVDLLELFSASLRRLPYTIIKAQSGEAALAILEEETPILIVLDVAMPHVSGIEVLRKTRANPRLASTKIMILTAVPARVESDDAALADKVIPKPITPRALEQAVVALLGE